MDERFKVGDEIALTRHEVVFESHCDEWWSRAEGRNFEIGLSMADWPESSVGGATTSAQSLGFAGTGTRLGVAPEVARRVAMRCVRHEGDARRSGDRAAPREGLACAPEVFSEIDAPPRGVCRPGLRGRNVSLRRAVEHQ